jgi:hypothetical protein
VIRTGATVPPHARSRGASTTKPVTVTASAGASTVRSSAREPLAGADRAGEHRHRRDDAEQAQPPQHLGAGQPLLGVGPGRGPRSRTGGGRRDGEAEDDEAGDGGRRARPGEQPRDRSPRGRRGGRAGRRSRARATARTGSTPGPPAAAGPTRSRSGRCAVLIAAGASRRHPVAQGGEALRPDAGHLGELLDAGEAALLLAVLEDLLDGRGADAVEGVELLGRSRC